MLAKFVEPLHWLCHSPPSPATSSDEEDRYDKNGEMVARDPPKKVTIFVRLADTQFQTVTVLRNNFQTFFDALHKITGLKIKDTVSFKFVQGPGYKFDGKLIEYNRRYRYFHSFPKKELSINTPKLSNSFYLADRSKYVLMIFHKMTNRVSAQYFLVDEKLFETKIAENPDLRTFSSHDCITRVRALLEDKEFCDELRQKFKSQSPENRKNLLMDYAITGDKYFLPFDANKQPFRRPVMPQQSVPKQSVSAGYRSHLPGDFVEVPYPLKPEPTFGLKLGPDYMYKCPFDFESSYNTKKLGNQLPQPEYPIRFRRPSSSESEKKPSYLS